MQDAVIFEKKSTGKGQMLGVLTLNRPQRLNALDEEVIDRLFTQLMHWRTDSAVVCVLLQGAGERAFCAGGDVLKLIEALRSDRQLGLELASEFFAREYRLDYLIHCYPKPIIVWADGITMGGGDGASQRGKSQGFDRTQSSCHAGN